MSKPLKQLRQIRIDKLNQIKKLGIDPYPAESEREQTIDQARKMMAKNVKVAGRIMAYRGHGKITFADLADESNKIQLVFRSDNFKDKQKKLLDLLDIGDFLQVSGKVFKTKTNEISIEVANFKLLSKSLRPLPHKWHGLKDVEERYRKRYLDFILNPEARQKIAIRTKVIQAMRQFLVKEGFLEVETPILETHASGALAKPFKTHINAYDMDLYLRICMGELWQKRLITAGFEKTFELGKAFRNEGVSKEHNPEFTMLEYYWAYADYKDNMKLQEKLVAYAVKKATGSLKIKYEDKKIDFTPPYPRKKYRDVILTKTSLDIEKFKDSTKLKAAVKNKGLKVEKGWSWGRTVDEFYKEFIRPKLIGPLFLTHQPAELKPLAKKDPQDPNYTQSFQLMAAGFELSNNYTEINDPIDQKERFDQQKELAKKGEDETMATDLDFVETLEYGMPPTTGAGIGIDRLVALLTNSHSLREVIAFPLMKPKE